MINSNRDRITYTVCEIIIAYRGWKLPFPLPYSDCRPYRRNAQQYKCNLYKVYIAKKYY